MGFKARLYSPGTTPAFRAYVHTAGFGDVYEGIHEAIGYLRDVMASQADDLTGFDFILAAIWGYGGDEPKKIIDLFGLSDMDQDKWPGNPDVSAWVLENGVYMKRTEITTGDTTCGDTLIMLGREEEHRRSLRCLDAYKNMWPHLGELEPEISMLLQEPWDERKKSILEA
jgi:hypothetical protein